MTIVSQNKMALINYDNMFFLEIQTTISGCDIRCIASENVEIILASYDSKDKARSVLIEILKNYNSNVKIYEMPLN